MVVGENNSQVEPAGLQSGAAAGFIRNDLALRVQMMVPMSHCLPVSDAIRTCAFESVSDRLRLVIFLVTCLASVRAHAGVPDVPRVPGGDPGPYEALREELLKMGEEDQRYRAELQDRLLKLSPSGVPDTAEDDLALQKKQDEIDARNLARLEEIIGQHGWPGRSMVGKEASGAAFLILQHADFDRQKKYLPVFKQAAAVGEARPADAAMLEDRILMREGKKQIYGTQVRSGPETGWKLELYPIEDEEHVDVRRAAVGLPPLADYLKLFGLEYKPKSKE